MNNHKTIIFPYEGYNFQILVGYHQTIIGIFLVDMQLTNKVSEPVNNKEFFFTLQEFRTKIIKREFDAEVKRILINSLEDNSTLFDHFKNLFGKNNGQ